MENSVKKSSFQKQKWIFLEISQIGRIKNKILKIKAEKPMSAINLQRSFRVLLKNKSDNRTSPGAVWRRYRAAGSAVVEWSAPRGDRLPERSVRASSRQTSHGVAARKPGWGIFGAKKHCRESNNLKIARSTIKQTLGHFLSIADNISLMRWTIPGSFAQLLSLIMVTTHFFDGKRPNICA